MEHAEKYSNGYETGSIDINIWLDETSGLDTLFANDWDQGFVAFSRGEEWMKDINGNKLKEIVDMVDPKEFGSGFGGICMEVNMWRKTNSGYEELCLEREGIKWYAQYWQLHEKPKESGAICYYKDCSLKDFKIGDPYSVKEIIVPDQRIHFFMTVKRGG